VAVTDPAPELLVDSVDISASEDRDAEGGDVGAEGTTSVVGESDPRAVDLALTAPAPELFGELDELGYPGGADRVTLAEQST